VSWHFSHRPSNRFLHLISVMPASDWFVKNRRAVIERAAWLKSKADGVLCEKQFSFSRIAIQKSGDLIRMCFIDPAGVRDELTWSGAVLDLNDPLDLSPTPYNQAFMLALLWRSQPRRIYVAGFGGGRVPLVLHHHFRQAIIDSAEIDVVVSGLGQTYFAISNDSRQRVHIVDARSTSKA
jgi:spermidine synthase